MMAKMFYTLDEAKSALGKSEDEIKTYAREGRLREFRDGQRLMFKADQVEQLRGELSGPVGGALDQVDLGVSDSGGLIGLVDTTGASGTSITLSDADAGHGSGSGSGGEMSLKDDTALASDFAAGSLGGVPSPGRPGASGAPLGGSGPSPSGTGLSGSFSGRSGAGINVFGTDEVIERADPSAQTAISGGIREQMELQGVGSGSGLLDLTRESDDTSLGAVLEEIAPSGSVAGLTGAGLTGAGMSAAGLTGAGLTGAGLSGAGLTGVGMRSAGGAGEASLGNMVDDAPVARVAAQPVYVQVPDPLAPAFGGAALGAAVVLFFGLFALVSAVNGTLPDLVAWFGPHGQNMGFPVIAAIMLGVTAVFFVGGLVLGKAVRR